MNKRLAITAWKAAKETKKTCMLDAYNNSFSTDISVTITTRIYASNHYWIMEQGEINETQKPQQDYPKIKTDKMLNVITLFSGYDSQALALNRLGIPYDLAAWCEIDRHAITAHNALFPQWADRNLGNVSKVDWAEWHKSHPQTIDLLTYSSPCQDFSSAGLQRGGEEGSGTRSGLLWETERAVRELRPRHLVFENVSGLVSDKFIDLFNRWQARLNSYGYTNFSRLMNAKDYGVPQNRLRIFMVSILDCQRAYYFPKPFKLERRLKDVLEQNVEERYYLKDEQVQKLVKSIDGDNDEARCIQVGQLYDKEDNPQNGRIYNPDGLCPSIMANKQGGQREPKIAEPLMLGWIRNEKGEITDRHPVNVANCVTANKRDNTQNYVMKPTKRLNITKDGTLELLRGKDGKRITTEVYTPSSAEYAPTILTDNNHCKIYEPTIASMKSRDKDNPTGVRTANNGNFAQRLEPSADQSTSNTITSVAKDNLVIEPKIIEDFYGTVRDPRVYTNEAPTLRADRSGLMATEGIRIRRLTERELYRLMDVEEKDIDTLLAAPIPRTQHAKLAGNSIVVACLYYIFRNIFVNTEPEAGTQTKLF